MDNFWELFGQGVLYAGFPVAILTMALGFISGKIKEAGILAIVAIPTGGFLGFFGVVPFFIGVSYYFFKDKIHGNSNKYKESYVKELEELSNLKERGILTEDEFLTKKNEILNNDKAA